jgi:hypothetical protein
MNRKKRKYSSPNFRLVLHKKTAKRKERQRVIVKTLHGRQARTHAGWHGVTHADIHFFLEQSIDEVRYKDSQETHQQEPWSTPLLSVTGLGHFLLTYSTAYWGEEIRHKLMSNETWLPFIDTCSAAPVWCPFMAFLWTALPVLLWSRV